MDASNGVTAEEYIAGQRQLELEAREAMPYEPDTCTYPAALRQLVFACLSCQDAGRPVGVCYSCSIQCHSTHDLVELFSKRNFVCDCGTDRMKGLACSIREGGQKHPDCGNSATGVKMRTGSFGEASRPRMKSLGAAQDIASSENTYNQNFQGRFCDCGDFYDPEKETRTMHQCFFGDVCGEDWYHEDCIQKNQGKDYKGEDAETKVFKREASEGEAPEEEDEENGADGDGVREKGEGDGDKDKDEGSSNTNTSHTTQPKLEPKPNNPKKHVFPENHAEFVCWKCVEAHSEAFREMCSYSQIAVPLNRSHEQGVRSQREAHEPAHKRARLGSCSVSLKRQFRPQMAALVCSLPESSALSRLLRGFPFFHEEDPVFEPPEDDAASNASEGSLYDLGSSALSSLPVPQALEGLQAYDVMKERLRGFFKGFVDQKKVVTEQEVRDFFGKMEQERQK